MIGLLRRLLPPRRPTTLEIAHAYQQADLHPRRLQLAADIAAPTYSAEHGDPGQDRLGTNRWANPGDLFPWVKTDYDRWIHIGGWAVRSDRQVRTFLPGTMRTHRPPR